MKKQLYLLCLFLIIGISTRAQNWKPFYNGDTVNYKSANSLIISNTIWVDSAKIVGSDSVFYLNRVFLNCDTCLHIPGYENCDTCFALQNQPQFLQRTIIKKENGKYLLQDTSSFEIQTKAQLNDSWIFDAAHAISAQVVDISLMNIMGNNDSVKTIKLSNNDTLKLSRNCGIIQFPNLYGIGNYYLAGIENRNMGEKVPDFWDIFNFNVGDVFQYYGNYTDGGMFVIDDYIKKYDILSKTISPNKIIYHIHLIQNGVRHWMDPNLQYWTPYVNNNNENLEINIPSNSNYDSDKIVNKFNNQKHTPGNCGPTNSYRTILTVDSLNIFTKTIGGFDPSSFYSIPNSYVPYNSIPDLFHRENGGVLDGATFAEYKVGLGRTAIITGCFEINGYELLEGYIKNGDTVGVITPDDTLLGINKNAFYIRNYITFSPNPFSETTTLKIADMNIDFPCILYIYDVRGQLIRTEKIINNTHILNKGLLQHGMYLYSIQDAANNPIGKGKLIIQ